MLPRRYHNTHLPIKIIFLASILTCIVGSYWILRPIKDALFVNMVGTYYLAYAKIVSALFLIPLLLGYGKLIDYIKKHYLFYIIIPFYALFFISIALLLQNSAIDINQQQCNSYSFFLGWSMYLGVESFILLVYSLFWSFASTITPMKDAKKNYAFIVAGAQIGTILGPELAKNAPTLGIPNLLFFTALILLCIPILIALFIKRYNPPAHTIAQKAHPTGPIEGLRLLAIKPYLRGVFLVSTLSNIPSTLLELALIFKTKEVYATTTNITSFLASYGQLANIFTLIFSLVLTNFIIKHLGLTLSLCIYPISIGMLLIIIFFSPTLNILFLAMIIIKSLAYGLYNPCKEMMYIPTSNDIKYKTKSWIDTIGYRLTESIGGSIGASLSSFYNVIFFGSIISFFTASLLLGAIIFVGKKNNYLIKHNLIIH